MRWFALIAQIVVTLAVAVCVIAVFGILVYLVVGGVGVLVMSMMLLVREFSAAGGELPTCGRIAEGLAVIVLIGLVWPLLPIAFAWSGSDRMEDP